MIGIFEKDSESGSNIVLTNLNLLLYISTAFVLSNVLYYLRIVLDILLNCLRIVLHIVYKPYSFTLKKSIFFYISFKAYTNLHMNVVNIFTVMTNCIKELIHGRVY